MNTEEVKEIQRAVAQVQLDILKSREIALEDQLHRTRSGVCRDVVMVEWEIVKAQLQDLLAVYSCDKL